MLPLASLSSSVVLPPAKSNAGRRGWLDVQQAIAMMFLKHHQSLSDAKLIENLNFNVAYQLFSGLVLAEGDYIKDTTLLSSWRSKFGHHMDVNFFQRILQHHWKGHISHQGVCKMDATCVESYITYPTSIKLLWRAMEWLDTMVEQQQAHLDEPESKIENRIVSLHKPYLRPIVRGKENKPLEFGAKVHVYQVDNFDFIEHIDYNNFNQTTRFESTIEHHQTHFEAVKQIAADRIYHTNKNPTICAKKNIHHNFTPKGSPPKDETITKQKRKMKAILSLDRATRLEGAFGNSKNHYLARANKARTKENEIVWIFFCLHAANASKMSKKVFAKKTNTPMKDS